MLFKNILVPIDFSHNSEIVIKYASELALQYRARLTLYHAIVMFQYDFNDKERVDQYEELLITHAREVKKHLRKSSNDISGLGITVDTAIERGVSVAGTLLDYIEKNSFDLVVMGTHGKTGLKHLLQGSVAEKIVRLAPVPVLTVHEKYKDFKLDHVLVPIDFSDASNRTLEKVIEMQRESAFKITCLHVVEKQVYPAYYAGGINSVFELDSGLKERVIHNLNKVAGKYAIEDKAEFAVLEGMPHHEIVEFARKNEVDLIAISTRGLTGFEYALIGSTTEKVVRLASVPVLTFK
jgi:nucleotide-binding universal stress UspA family protein